jgi:hypothetical protein
MVCISGFGRRRSTVMRFVYDRHLPDKRRWTEIEAVICKAKHIDPNAEPCLRSYTSWKLLQKVRSKGGAPEPNNLSLEEEAEIARCKKAFFVAKFDHIDLVCSL